ncbi:hypothetical protein [Streptomyces ipomoeae]|uniref:Uncharacterized protein n=1 Tax=Streptomyces ipomoeae 91-03 TaxID=698759 RepID=L1L7Y8_9ACTN|nr:hypothetical protein [Streptomyces ipomoeae]EKX69037.1 hypothetical protein STRIP9103_09079 [Streptomyces ipomoeae 91-03]
MLADWARRWERELGRPLSLGVFESSGPFDATRLGRTLSSHFRDTDWVIHSPDKPMAWRTPVSRIIELVDQQGQTSRVSAAAARSRPTTTRTTPGVPNPSPGTANPGNPGLGQQAGHIRRPGNEQQGGNKPNQR